MNPREAPLRTHVEFFVSDLERSIAFYEALGFRVARRHGDWVRLDRYGAELALQGDSHALAGPHYFTPHIRTHPRGVGVEVPVEVEDIDALHERAQRLPGAVVKTLQDRPWGARDFRVADPDGYFVRFTTPLPRATE